MKYWKLIIFFTLLTFVSLIGFKWVAIQSGAPQYSGNIQLKDLSSTVKTSIDKWGIPHLSANNEADLYRAFGFYMAQERLFQMDIHRRLATGRLSEIFGRNALKVDKTFRTLSLAHYGKEFHKNLIVSKETHEALAAYFDGINQFIKTKKYPLEYHLLGISPAAFKIEEAYAFLGYMAYSFGIGFKTDLLFNELLTKLGEKKFDSLRGEPRGISPERTTFIATPRIDSQLDEVFKLTEDFLGVFEGSNGWILGPQFSNSGGILFASDPHVSFSLPGTWLEAHLKSGDFEIYGHFLPLVPFAVFGFNQRFGWGLTISYIDDMDFYQENVNYENKTYLKDSSEVALKIREEVIKIKGEEDIKLNVYETHRGPLLDPILEHQGLSLKWTYYLPENNIFEGLYKLNHSNNIKEFEKAINLGTAPGLNVMYADKEGNMARFIHGAIPKRRDGVASDIILPGNDSAYDYLGYLKDEEKPIEINPTHQKIISANYRPKMSNPNLRGYWQPSDRYKTIEFFLDSKKTWSLEEFKHIQTAPFNVETPKILKTLLKGLENEKLNDQESIGFEVLKNWNGTSFKDSVASTIYYEWLDRIGRSLFDEFEDDLYYRYCVLADYWVVLKRSLENNEDLWWDISATDQIEKRDDILRKSYLKTIKELEDQLGKDIHQWHWGNTHTLTFRHAFGIKKGMGEFFNLGPYEIDGSYNSVNNFRKIGCANGFEVKSGPSSRRIIDFSRPTESFGILPIGNSGNFLSEFFDNQLILFLEGRYRSQYLSKESVKKHKKYQLEFIPYRSK